MGISVRGDLMYNNYSVERLSTVDEALAVKLDTLFDEGKQWDAEQGRLFLENLNNAFFVATKDGQPAGFLTAHLLQRWDKRRAEVLIYEVGVLEKFRQQGIGRGLIEKVLEWGRTEGADEAWVLTEKDNRAAMQLYSSTSGVEDSPNTTMFVFELKPV